MIGDLVALGDACEVSWGDTKTTKSSYVDSGFPAFSASGQDGFLPKFDHEGPGVVLSAIGAQCGKTWFVDGQWSCIKNTMYLKSSREDVDIKYVFYATRNPAVWPRRGAAQPFISLGDAKRVEINLPTLAVQRSVVKIISTYDDLIDNNGRRIALLEQSARLLYREWFVHLRFPGHEHIKVVGGVPDGWVPGSFDDVADILSGGTPKTGVPEYWDGDIPFFTPKDAHDMSYVLETEKRLTQEGLNKCNSQLFPKDTVLITARGTVGKVSLAQVPMAMNQSCYALRGKGYMSQLLLYCALVEAVGHFKNQAGGTVFSAIVVDTFKRIPCLLPPEELVIEFTKLASPIFQQIDRLLLQSQRLRQARDLLLPRLMRGEIAV